MMSLHVICRILSYLSGLCYIGKIFLKAKSEHESHRNGKNCPITAHFDDSLSFRFQGTKKVMSQDRSGYLVETEAYWMFILQTLTPMLL